MDLEGRAWAGSYYRWAREPWRESVAFLRQRAAPSDLIIVAPPHSAPFEYYARGSLSYRELPGRVTAEKRGQVVATLEMLERGRTRLWLVFRKTWAGAGQSIIELLRSRYQELEIPSPVGYQSNVFVRAFDLTHRTTADRVETSER